MTIGLREIIKERCPHVHVSEGRSEEGGRYRKVCRRNTLESKREIFSILTAVEWESFAFPPHMRDDMEHYANGTSENLG